MPTSTSYGDMSWTDRLTGAQDTWLSKAIITSVDSTILFILNILQHSIRPLKVITAARGRIEVVCYIVKGVEVVTPSDVLAPIACPLSLAKTSNFRRTSNFKISRSSYNA